MAHPEGLSKERIGTLFWPDASPSELKTRFKNTIYRMRSALNQEAIFFENEIYRFNWQLDYDYDLELFEDKVAEGNAATDPVLRIAAYTAAVHHYRGNYLSDVDADWCYAERERLQRSIYTITLTLAQLQYEASNLKTALDYCQRLLQDDPCLEDAHRLAMRIHSATGNRSAIARQFDRCRQALLEEIDAPPSPQTEKLYRSLMR